MSIRFNFLNQKVCVLLASLAMIPMTSNYAADLVALWVDNTLAVRKAVDDIATTGSPSLESLDAIATISIAIGVAVQEESQNPPTPNPPNPNQFTQSLLGASLGADAATISKNLQAFDAIVLQFAEQVANIKTRRCKPRKILRILTAYDQARQALVGTGSTALVGHSGLLGANLQQGETEGAADALSESIEEVLGKAIPSLTPAIEDYGMSLLDAAAVTVTESSAKVASSSLFDIAIKKSVTVGVIIEEASP